MPLVNKLLIVMIFITALGYSIQSVREENTALQVAGRAPESLFETTLSKLAIRYIDVFADFNKQDTVELEHELVGVSVEMLDWWWNNIDDTARYMTWHPKDHIYFKWTVPPSDQNSGRYSPGAIHEVRERIGGIPVTLRITWMPFDSKGFALKESHFVKAAGTLINNEKNKPLLFLHEYRTIPTGVFMRSTFKVPSGLPEMFKQGLAAHCREEMQFLAGVLPSYYNAK